MNYSLVTIVPAAYREAVNAAAEANGYGPDNISAPVSADGNAPATHYGSRAWANQEFRDTYESMFPPELLAVCIIDWQPHDPDTIGQHFDAVCAANNLQRVEPDA